MTARITPIPRSRRRAIALEQLQLDPELWLIACGCGHQERHPDRETARRARRAHQAAHTRAAQTGHPVERPEVTR